MPLLRPGGPVAPAPPADGRVLLEAHDGRVEPRPLEGFSVTHPGEAQAALVRFEGVAEGTGAAPVGDAAEVILLGGDRLRGRIAGGRGETLQLELAGGVVLPISIDALASLSVPARIPTGSSATVEAAAEGDVLYRRTGAGLNRITGAVEEFSEDGLAFHSVLGSRTFAWDEVAALFVEAFGEPETTPNDRRAVSVDLRDGSRVRGRCVRIDSTGCLLRLTGGEEVLLPVASLAEVSVDDGSLAFLSALEPAEVEEGSPFGDELGMTWPHRMDRSVTGQPLVAAGQLYTRGIGVHAPSRLTWRLDGDGPGWRELRGSCALSDEVERLPARGSVVFRILINGEPRWESGVVRGGDAPLAIPPLSLEGARELTLVVDMATDLHVGDRANWLRMLVVR